MLTNLLIYQTLSDSSLKPTYEPLFKGSFEEKSLENNWRSSINIVEFNNWIFKKLLKILTSKIS